MNLEDLNKTQIILLTLLVSFVSAIATSIFTVKLLEEAPKAVTQTINRVVERTIERVVPAEPTTSGNVEQTVIEKETTIVVKEEDLITESIEKNKRTIVRLVTIVPGEEPIEAGTSTPEVVNSYTFHGIGVIVTSGGMIATAPEVAEIADLYAVTPDGIEHGTTLERSNDEIAFLQVEPVTPEETVSLTAAVFVDPSTLKLGQTVIALGGKERTSVSMGIVASLIEGDIVSGESTKKGIVHVQTNVSGSIPGSPLVNIFGEVVGINADGVPGLFTSSSVIEEAMKSVGAANDLDEIETTEANSATAES